MSYISSVLASLQDNLLRKYNNVGVGSESYDTGEDDTMLDLPVLKHYPTNKSISPKKISFGEQKDEEDDETDEQQPEEEIPADQGVPYEEVPQEEVPEETPQEELPPDAPVEEIPQEELPQEEMPVEEVPQEEIPQDQVPQEEIPQDQVPQEEIPVEEVPQDQVPQEELPPEEAPLEDEGDPGMGDPGMGEEGIGDPGMDTGMGDMGMPGQEEEKTSSELGRIYELKKIYSRLTAIETYLSNESDPALLEVRAYVSKAIELFELISANFNSYKDKLDDTIIMYYKFVKEVYDIVRNHYKKTSKKHGD